MFPRGDKGAAIPHPCDHRTLFSKLLVTSCYYECSLESSASEGTAAKEERTLPYGTCLFPCRISSKHLRLIRWFMVHVWIVFPSMSTFHQAPRCHYTDRTLYWNFCTINPALFPRGNFESSALLTANEIPALHHEWRPCWISQSYFKIAEPSGSL